MSDYINRHEAISAIKQMSEEHYPYKTIFRAIRILHHVPPSDVRKNVHAEKIISGGEHAGATCWFECSHCHGTVDIQDMFCKHCGAVLEYEK